MRQTHKYVCFTNKVEWNPEEFIHNVFYQITFKESCICTLQRNFHHSPKHVSQVVIIFSGRSIFSLSAWTNHCLMWLSTWGQANRWFMWVYTYGTIPHYHAEKNGFEINKIYAMSKLHASIHGKNNEKLEDLKLWLYKTGVKYGTNRCQIHGPSGNRWQIVAPNKGW